MSRTEDRLRAKDAYWNGYYAGLGGERSTANPYKVGAVSGTNAQWSHGWEKGYEERLSKRMNCQACDQISLQRITTRAEWNRDIELVSIGKGKKPYEVRCKKCKRQWKTNAEYAQELGAVGGARRRVCPVCDIPRAKQEFGKVGSVECCSVCMPGLIEKSTEGIRRFTKKLIAGRP